MIKKVIKVANPVVFCLLILGVDVSAHSQSTDRQLPSDAIQAIAGELADGLVKHDAAALAALFAADGVLVSPFGIETGREAIQQSYEQLFHRLDVKQYKHTVEHVQDAGTNRAYGVGHWDEMSIPAGKADPIHLGGFWGTLYEKQGDGWKIVLNSWSLAPPQTPQPSAK